VVPSPLSEATAPEDEVPDVSSVDPPIMLPSSSPAQPATRTPTNAKAIGTVPTLLRQNGQLDSASRTSLWQRRQGIMLRT
jgi:hypothetical protein